MKRLIIVLFVFGMMSCGQKEAPKVEETQVTEEAMPAVVDSAAAVVDSVVTEVEEAVQE